jgi:membrane protein
MAINPRESVTRAKSSMAHFIWGQDVEAMPRWKAALIGFVRVLYGVGRTLATGDLNMRAMSLVYTTLLSMIPLLAISFSVLKGFGFHNEIIEGMLLPALEPFGDKGVEITERILEFVEKTRAGVLGAVGVLFLVYTVISLTQKIEGAFNYTWRITVSRTLARRFSDYLSVILVGPVLVISAMGATATIMSTSVVTTLAAIEPFGYLIEFATKLIPYAFIVLAFTFVYSFIPNTKVKITSAFVGALISGVLWETVGWAFASFVVSSTKYSDIYSGLATPIIFMIWLYLSWLILLIGATISFYHQNPEYLISQERGEGLSNRVKEKLALMVGALIVDNYYANRPAWTLDSLSRKLGVPALSVEPIIDSLEKGGLLKRTDDVPATFLPARPLEATGVGDLLDAVRSAEEQSYLDFEGLRSMAGVSNVIEHLDEASRKALSGRTIKDLGTPGDDAPKAAIAEAAAGGS